MGERNFSPYGKAAKVQGRFQTICSVAEPDGDDAAAGDSDDCQHSLPAKDGGGLFLV